MGSHTIKPGARTKSSRHDRSRDADTRVVLDSIRRIVQILRVASREAENAFGLSAAQLFVLHKLAESDAISINELAARTLTHQSSVSVVVQKLADRGLVLRESAAADARRMVLTLTPEGRRLIGKSPQAAQEQLIAAINRFPARQRRLLAQLLQQLADDSAGSALPAPMFFEEPPIAGKKSHGSR